MAAPFVAAVAAWLADNDASITTPSALETAVRNNAFQWSGTFINYQGQSVSGPYTDGAGLPVRVVQLP